MKHFSLLIFCLLIFHLQGQDIPDPAARKPYKFVVQTGIALQWFDTQFKSFTLSAERPLNLYNHVGLQANFFFPNDEYYYRNLTGKSWELGIFSKSFLHGRLTGRRSSTYVGPDIRLGQRVYRDYSFDGFQNTYIERKASTFKFMARVGWQYHFGPAVLEIAFPIGIESENFKVDAPPGQFYYGWATDSEWFVMAPSISLGVGF